LQDAGVHTAEENVGADRANLDRLIALQDFEHVRAIQRRGNAAQFRRGCVAQALKDRPEMEEARVEISNSHIALEGSKNQLLPELDLVATGYNSALARQPNPLPDNSPVPLRRPSPSSIGGIGTGLTHIGEAK